jgi:tRNA-Thr(GGU) m(6)t(6)A37 methyltransferase TsaA
MGGTACAASGRRGEWDGATGKGAAPLGVRHAARESPAQQRTDADMPDDHDVRPGEITVTLPDQFDAGLYFIGRIHTPWKRREDCPKNPREAGAAQCTITIDPRFADGLQGLVGCSHVIVLYWMERARRDLVQQVPRHLGVPRGTFALRSPARPNPIALSVAPLLGIDGATLTVSGLDCLDGTACVDVKPYFASIDSVPDAVVARPK